MKPTNSTTGTRQTPSLASLPLELLYQITSTFTPHELASLALTSRALFTKLGPSSPLLNGSSSMLTPELTKAKARLLSLLSRDPSIYPYLVPCPACAVFHSPFPRDWWTRSAGDQISLRACEAVLHASRRTDKADFWAGVEMMSPFLPLQCQFNMVAAVARAWRGGWSQHGWEAGAVLDSGDEMELDGEAEGGGDGWRVHRYHEFRVRGGHLLMKTERLFWLPMSNSQRLGGDKGEDEQKEEVSVPATEGGNSAKKRGGEESDYTTTAIRNALKKLKETMEKKSQWHAHNCCQHVWWAQYRAVFDDPQAIWWRKGQGDRSTDVCARCKKPHVGEVERVKPCGKCYTDHSVGYVNMPDGDGWVGVFTTWKDLGSGESLDSPEWQSYFGAATFPDKESRNSPVPEIYWAWEGLENKRVEAIKSERRCQEREGQDDRKEEVRVMHKPLVRSTRLARLRRR